MFVSAERRSSAEQTWTKTLRWCDVSAVLRRSQGWHTKETEQLRSLKDVFGGKHFFFSFIFSNPWAFLWEANNQTLYSMSGTKSAKKEKKITSDTVDGFFTDSYEFISHNLENSSWENSPFDNNLECDWTNFLCHMQSGPIRCLHHQTSQLVTIKVESFFY